MPTNKKIEAPEKASEAIIAHEPQTIQTFNAESLISQAITNKVPVETLERLLAMRTQLKQEWAKEEYIKAMSQFQSECPTIEKRKEATDKGKVLYKYAPIESIVEQVKGLLQKHGFSYATDMEMLEDGVRVSCKVTHISGHSEENFMHVPLGFKTGIMSQSQVVAAAQTFAKRYAFCNAFGILTGDEDNDAKQYEKQDEENEANYPLKPITKSYPPSEKQIGFIKSLMIQKRLTDDEVYDMGFDLKNLTGGNEGTASELIERLQTYIPTNQITTNEEGYTEEGTLLYEALNVCQSAEEYKQISYDITQARRAKQLSQEDWERLSALAKEVVETLKNN